MKFYDWSKEIKQLESGEREVILEVNEALDQMFYDGYLKMDEDVFVTVMNLLIKLCIIYKDERDTFEALLNTVFRGAGYEGTSRVDFAPLAALLADKNFLYIADMIIIILGSSCQPGYIDILENFETDDELLINEKEDAILELEHFRHGH